MSSRAAVSRIEDIRAKQEQLEREVRELTQRQDVLDNSHAVRSGNAEKMSSDLNQSTATLEQASRPWNPPHPEAVGAEAPETSANTRTTSSQASNHSSTFPRANSSPSGFPGSGALSKTPAHAAKVDAADDPMSLAELRSVWLHEADEIMASVRKSRQQKEDANAEHPPAEPPIQHSEMGTQVSGPSSPRFSDAPASPRRRTADTQTHRGRPSFSLRTMHPLARSSGDFRRGLQSVSSGASTPRIEPTHRSMTMSDAVALRTSTSLERSPNGRDPVSRELPSMVSGLALKPTAHLHARSPIKTHTFAVPAQEPQPPLHSHSPTRSSRSLSPPAQRRLVMPVQGGAQGRERSSAERLVKQAERLVEREEEERQRRVKREAEEHRLSTPRTRTSAERKASPLEGMPRAEVKEMREGAVRRSTEEALASWRAESKAAGHSAAPRGGSEVMGSEDVEELSWKLVLGVNQLRSTCDDAERAGDRRLSGRNGASAAMNVARPNTEGLKAELRTAVEELRLLESAVVEKMEEGRRRTADARRMEDAMRGQRFDAGKLGEENRELRERLEGAEVELQGLLDKLNGSMDRSGRERGDRPGDERERAPSSVDRRLADMEHRLTQAEERSARAEHRLEAEQSSGLALRQELTALKWQLVRETRRADSVFAA